MIERVDTLVLGAGISGLAYAHARGTDADLLVLERSSRAGGWIRTVSVEGPVPLRYEAGPEALSDPSGEVARSLGFPASAIENAPDTAKRRFLVSRGRLVEVPLSPLDIAQSPLLSARGKLRLLREPWRDPRKALDGSIADFARHRLGEEALEALVDPFVRGVHAAGPERISLRAAFPNVVEMVERHGNLFTALRKRERTAHGGLGLWKPARGMEELPRTLARDLGGRLRLGIEAKAIAPDRDGWRVRTSDGEIAARAVVLALPLQPAARLLAAVAPRASQALETMLLDSLVSLVQVYPREAIAHPLDGFGYLVPAREGLNHLGTLFSSTLSPASAPEGLVVLRTLAGGADKAVWTAARDERLVEAIVPEVCALLGIESAPQWTHVERHLDAIPRFDLEHPRRLETLESSLPSGISVLGNFTRGLGIGALVEAARRLAAEHGDPVPSVQLL